jgi:transposase
MSLRGRMRSCCSIVPDGIRQATSTCPNITPIFLPSRSPELNPVENVWQYLRQTWLSNTVFENYNAIVDAACNAWRNLIAHPERITSIGMRKWAHIGQTS